MRKSLATAALIVAMALTSVPAMAQSAAGPRGSFASSQSDPGQSQQSALTEDFDQEPVDGWEYSCEHAFVKAGTGRALATRGGGHAMWIAAGQVGDFALKLRYGYEKGVGDVFFRSTESSQGMEFYFLRLEPRQVVLGRRLHTVDGQYPEKILAAVPVVLGPRAWHDVIIQASGGQFAVSVNGQEGVLQAVDPNPLRSGLCGLGVIASSGLVLYDDVALISEKTAEDSELASQTSNWP